MSGTTSTTIQAAIKEVVLEKIFKGFKEDNTLANYFNWDGGGDIEVNDRGVRFIPYLRPNPSGGYFSQAGGLAVTGNQTFVAATCAYTRYSMGAAYSGDAIKQMNSPSAVEKGMAPYMRRDKTTMLNNFEQDLFEAGTGTKAIRDASAPVGTVVTFYTTVAGGSTYGARRVLIGGRYNFINPATGAIRAGGGTSVCTVTAIADSTAAVTFDAIPNDTATGDLLVRENTYNAAPRGLAYAVSSNSLTIFNIDRSIYPEWNSNVFDAGGIAMTFSIARRMDYILDVRCTDGQSKIVDKFVSVPMYQAMEEVYNPHRWIGQRHAAALGAGRSHVVRQEGHLVQGVPRGSDAVGRPQREHLPSRAAGQRDGFGRVGHLQGQPAHVVRLPWGHVLRIASRQWGDTEHRAHKPARTSLLDRALTSPLLTTVRA